MLNGYGVPFEMMKCLGIREVMLAKPCESTKAIELYTLAPLILYYVSFISISKTYIFRDEVRLRDVNFTDTW